MKKTYREKKINLKEIAKICYILFPSCIFYIFMIFIISLFTSSADRISSTKDSYYPWLLMSDNIAVDSKKNLYLDTFKYILVYNEDGKFSHSFKIDTYGSMRFSVDENDNLVVAPTRLNRIYIFNQEGTLINTSEDPEDIYYNRLPEEYKTINENGETYRLYTIFGYNFVTRHTDNTTKVIYWMPIHLYLVKVAIILLVFSFIIGLIYQFIKNDKKMSVYFKL